MHMAGSVLPSEGYGTLDPQGFHGGILRVERGDNTYSLTFAHESLGVLTIASHPNGYSCKNLADRLANGPRSELPCHSAWAQACYICQCGGDLNLAAWDAMWGVQ